MDYCDTNVLTSFVNRNSLSKLGNFGFNKFKDEVKGIRSNNAENSLKNVKRCVISRDVLLRDIGRHGPSLGAVMTSTGLKNIELRKINGTKKGKRIFNEACGDVDENSGFIGNFVKRKILNMV